MNHRETVPAPAPAPVPGPAPLCAGIRLSAEPAAAGLARRFVRRSLEHWRLGAHTDTATLVVSELAANAAQATDGTDGMDGTENAAGRPGIAVRLRVSGRSLFIEVRDHSDRAPRPQGPTMDGEHGRGLLLVEALSSHWGVHRAPAGGKTVWAELELSGAPQPPAPAPAPAPGPARAGHRFSAGAAPAARGCLRGT
ncbi:ATP-binding protein [Streptomyces aidingensis]|uniref:Anti-sigma regulatory factor (Ser/Thr protein kinase) n=1 Tax=Streptomyces aidingensis TaxID=910347 RepID=A0A1I1H663_9ACTN|nr:ATP-binding protein [Streptomyces aidingensis]SFC19246.1 Anti-sigma regulatory factor (Ser/Thr protein kinase) [Streptomyces aidingensis]